MSLEPTKDLSSLSVCPTTASAAAVLIFGPLKSLCGIPFQVGARILLYYVENNCPTDRWMDGPLICFYTIIFFFRVPLLRSCVPTVF